MHYARRPLIGSASGGVYRHGTRTSTKIRPDHGSVLRGPDTPVTELLGIYISATPFPLLYMSSTSFCY